MVEGYKEGGGKKMMEPTVFQFSDGTTASEEGVFGAVDFYLSADLDELREMADFSLLAQKELDARWALGL